MSKYLVSLFLLLPCMVFANEHGGGSSHGGGSFIWRVITFIVFAAILYKLLKDPVKNLLVNRTDEIKKLIEDAERAKEEAEKELASYKNKLASMEEELETMKKRAFDAAEKEKEAILEDAEKNIEKLKKFAENMIESELLKAKNELKEMTVELAIKLTEERLGEILDKSKKEELTREYINKLSEVSN